MAIEYSEIVGPTQFQTSAANGQVNLWPYGQLLANVSANSITVRTSLNWDVDDSWDSVLWYVGNTQAAALDHMGQPDEQTDKPGLGESSPPTVTFENLSPSTVVWIVARARRYVDDGSGAPA